MQGDARTSLGGTDWPEDAFTRMVTAADGQREIAGPARNSYDGDGNMQAIDAFSTFADEADRRDLATYTGRPGWVGPERW